MKIDIHTGWVAIVVSVILALIGSAYKVGTDLSKERMEHLEKAISEYKESGNLNLPDTFKALREASQAFALNKKEREEFGTLHSENSQLKKQVSDFEKQHSQIKDDYSNLLKTSKQKEDDLSKRINDLNEKVAGYEIETKAIILRPGQAFELVRNVFLLGLRSVSSESVSININNDYDMMNIGNVKILKHGHRTCQLRLIELKDGKEAKFSFGCSN